MNDRPSLQELLDAVHMHLEQNIVPAVKGDQQLYFRTLVAMNLLQVATREISLSQQHLHAEWERLNGIQGTDVPPPIDPRHLREALARRNQMLTQAIRRGEYDDRHGQAALLAHFKATSREQLEIANPRFLMAVDQEELSR